MIPRFNIDYDFKDFFYGIKSLISNKEPDLEQLEQIFGKRNFYFTNSGRSSLYVILRSLNLPKGSKIGVPLYSCTVVFDAILNAGYTPWFIDIDIDNYTLDPDDLKNKIDLLRAVVVIHTFGRPADIDRIKEIAKNKPVIEDCAHSLLSEYKGKITGTFGAASFFSFGLGKSISAGGGGMIILNDNRYKENIQNEIDSLNHNFPLGQITNLTSAFLQSILYHKPWYGCFTLPVGSLIRDTVNSKRHKLNVKKISTCNLAIFLKKLSMFQECMNLQRKNSLSLLDKLQLNHIILPVENKSTLCNYFLFPIRFKNKIEREKAFKFLHIHGIDCSKLYSLTPITAKLNYNYGGDCPKTEICADTILTIPNFYNLYDNDIEKIINTIKQLDTFL